MRSLNILETAAVAGGTGSEDPYDSSGGGGSGFFDWISDAFSSVGDFLGFDGSFGFDGGGGNLSFGNFFDATGSVVGDFMGFDGSFGYDGGGGNLSFDNFMGAVSDTAHDFAEAGLFVAGAIWTSPNTIVGTAIGLVGYALDNIAYSLGIATDARATIHMGENGIEFWDNPFMAPDSAITLGNVQIFDNTPSQQGANGQFYGVHEDLHTPQAMLLGPFYVPAWLVGAAGAIVNNQDPFGTGNFMENGPYNGTVFGTAGGGGGGGGGGSSSP